jgi:hypothetical protein
VNTSIVQKQAGQDRAGRNLIIPANPNLSDVLCSVRLEINFSNLCLFVDQQERLSVTIRDIKAFYSAYFSFR